MKNFKRIAALMLALAMVLSLAACGDSKQTAAEPKADEFTPVEWIWSNQHPEDNLANVADMEMIAAIEEATEGRVKITLYNNSQLGDYLSVFEQVMLGTVQVHHGSTNEAYDARFLGGFLPYLSTGYAQLPYLYGPDSYLYKSLTDLYAGFGIQFCGFFCEGFDGIGSAKPVTDAAKIGAEKGILIRVPAMDTFNLCNQMLGFRTSTIPFSDAYTSMQTGLVDGASGVPANQNYQYFRDVIKYFYDYQQVQEATQILINKDAFDSLLPEDQEAIRKIINDKCAESYDLAQADEELYKQKLRDEGIEVVEFTDEERQAFADACHEQVWPQLAETFGQDFLDGCLADANKAK